MKNITQLVSVLAVTVGLSSAAFAGTVATTYSDLILGFRDTANTSVNLEVNLGNIGTFTEAAAGSSFQVATLGSDLSTVFGGDWNSTTLKFGVIGTTGKAGSSSGTGPDAQPLSTVWLSWDSGATAPARKIAVQQNTAVTNILNLFNSSAIASLNVGNVTVLSENSAQVDATKVGSWSVSETTGSAFGVYTQASFESDGGFTGSESFDLYELLPGSGAGSKVGTFSLSDAGVLTFTSAGLYATAVPEPATYALFASAAMLGFVVLRRRIRNKA